MLKRVFPLLILLIVLTSCASVTSESVEAVPVAKSKLTFIDFYSDECLNCADMVTVVRGLESLYHDRMTFEYLNIETDGKSLYRSIGLQGNPIFVIILADGTVGYRGFGRVPKLALDKEIRKAIGL